MKFYSLLTLFLSILLSNQLRAECALKTTWEEWPPYQYSHNGVPTGVDTDLVRLIVQKSGCTLSFHERPWARALREISLGTMDFTAAASITEKRKKYAHYSISYRSEAMVLLVENGSSKKYPFKTLQELLNSDFKLGVTRDVFYGDEFNSAIADPKVNSQLYYSTGYLKNFEKLILRKINGLLGDDISLLHLAKTHGLLDKVEIHPLPINTDKVYLMFSKKSVSPDVINKINESITEIKNNGEFDKIVNKYMP